MVANTRFDERQARGARTLDEAEQSLLDFIREGELPDSQHHVKKYSRGFDLYLPWLILVLESRPAYPDVEPLDLSELQGLYMDAAWDLVLKGVLRPGPRLAEEETDTTAYGRGYSLMRGVPLDLALSL